MRNNEETGELKCFLVREKSGWNPTFHFVMAKDSDGAFKMAVEGEYFSDREFWSVDEVPIDKAGVFFSGELG